MTDLFKFHYSNNKLKITYLGLHELSVMISPFLISFDYPIESIVYTFSETNKIFVPDIDYTGCNIVTIRLLETKQEIVRFLLPKEAKVNSKKNVFCLGLNKSGTSSLTEVLQEMGYKFPPYVLGEQFITPNVLHDDYNLVYSIIKNPRYNGYQDLPFSLPNTYEKIYKKYPNDIYILPIRDTTNWVKSVLKFYSFSLSKVIDENHIDSTSTYNMSNVKTQSLNNFILPMFKSWGIDLTKDLNNQLYNFYEKYNKNVIDYFTKKGNNNFLVVKIDKEGELKKLNKFFGNSDISKNFPVVNKTLNYSV